MPHSVPLLNILIEEAFRRIDGELSTFHVDAIREPDCTSESVKLHCDSLNSALIQFHLLSGSINALISSEGADANDFNETKRLASECSEIIDTIQETITPLTEGIFSDDDVTQLEIANRFVSLYQSLLKKTHSGYRRARLIAGRDKYFISYVNEKTLGEKYVADLVELLLLRKGRSVWRDHKIASGEKIDDVIVKEIRQSDAFIAIHSKDYMASDYCLGEIACAIEWGKKNKTYRTVAIKTDEAELPLPYRGRAWEPGKTREEIILAVNGILQSEQ